MDEPTAGLDVATRVELHDVMRELQANGTTIILATHDMAEAEELSDRVAILLNHKLATIGTPIEITATGAGLTKVSVRTQDASLSDPAVTFPAVQQRVSKDGYDISLTRAVADAVSIPVIASGGAGNVEHLYDVLKEGEADAVLAASIFHYREITIKEAKDYLISKNIVMRI